MIKKYQILIGIILVLVFGLLSFSYLVKREIDLTKKPPPEKEIDREAILKALLPPEDENTPKVTKEEKEEILSNLLEAGNEGEPQLTEEEKKNILQSLLPPNK